MADDMITNPRQFRFELVAPEKVELSGPEESVILPGEMGSFTVLAGHTPLLTGLRAGVVSVVRSNGEKLHYFISGGFADIGNAHCIILTPHVVPVEKLSLDKIDADIAEVTAKREAVMADDAAYAAVMSELDDLMLRRDAAIKYGS